MRFAVWAFVVGFILIGIVATLRYDEWRDALTVAALGGIVCAVLMGVTVWAWGV